DSHWNCPLVRSHTATDPIFNEQWKISSGAQHVNRFARELARVCQQRLLDEKWLIAPSLRVGHQWLDIVTLANGPVLNVRIKTLKGLALDLAGPEMARLGVSLITATGSLIFVDRIINRLRSSSTGYL